MHTNFFIPAERNCPAKVPYHIAARWVWEECDSNVGTLTIPKDHPGFNFCVFRFGWLQSAAMFRLTRETRFAINSDGRIQAAVTNSHGGFPTLVGFGHYYQLRITLAGELRPETGYLRNIKNVDEVLRREAIPIVADAIRCGTDPAAVPIALFDRLSSDWPGTSLDEIELSLSPFLSVGCLAKEHPMVRLSQKFEFSAAHRLHNPALSEAQNREAFGKCNNPLGHGHNYELQITLAGKPDGNGLLIDIPEFERIVAQAVIERFDHKFLNLELAEFRELNPSVENIARVIYGLLKPRFAGNARLASVTVWETPKTWCEYFE
jgi:6-pyruvoyltetrahydropterin/6-carboxytetrahydropterin synthase